MSKEERVAFSLCQEEAGRQPLSLDQFFAKVDRTWRRYIPEAESLINRMERNGLRVEVVDE